MKKLVIIFLIFTGLWQISKSTEFQLFGELISHGSRFEKVIALTFDDGPKPVYTERVLKMLADQRVKATFFVVGEELARSPHLTAEILRGGHQLGNHSYSHSRMLLKSPSFVANEIEKTDKLIRKSGFEEKIYFRPPFGKKLFTLPYYLEQKNITSVTWDVDPGSALREEASAREIADYVIDQAENGSIILLHVMFVTRKNELAAVPMIIEGLRELDYEFVTVDELLASGQ
ncbi:MAG: polysaccharide deacetylase family protein [Pseudomonadales bacterium]|nr:polysaccharide deacetylase family protein [Pseudomonadales bacterium]NRA14041.1 polysaccharide deacetylase family protein [Oceanospirillaceae bacterium]